MGYAGAVNIAEASVNEFIINYGLFMLVIMEQSPGAPLRRVVLTLLPGADFSDKVCFFLKCQHRQNVGT